MSSGRIDQYIDTTLSRMEVDNEQRLEIEREWRLHPEALIEKAVAKGLERERAEWEAMIALGEAPVPGRGFGVAKGAKRIGLERLAFALPLVIPAFGGAIDDIGPLGKAMAALAAFAIAGVLAFKSIYERVMISGGLVLYRLGRRTKRLAFEDIEEVRFEKGHLIGGRGIVLEHDEGKTKLPADLRGMRLAAMVWQALSPNVIRPEVSDSCAPCRCAFEESGLQFDGC